LERAPSLEIALERQTLEPGGAHHQSLDNPPSRITIDGCEALMARYVYSRECSTMIEVDKGSRRYTILLTGRDFEGENGIFPQVISGLKLK
jgi:hypothetical protein